MIAERPRHGYELIKEIEERFGGAYSPSPGVIYPTLSWLDDMGYAAIEPEASGRKLYRITSEEKPSSSPTARRPTNSCHAWLRQLNARRSPCRRWSLTP